MQLAACKFNIEFSISFLCPRFGRRIDYDSLRSMASKRIKAIVNVKARAEIVNCCMH